MASGFGVRGRMRQTGMLLIGAMTVFTAFATKREALGQTATAQQPSPPVRFAFGGNAAEIPAKFVGRLVLLPVRINQSQPCLFELDSTARVSSIDPDRAAELGLGGSRAAVLDFGGVAIALPALPQVAKKEFGAQVGRAYEGTIGQDVFLASIIEVDYVRQTVRFYDPASYRYTGPGKSLHLDFTSGAPVVRAKLSFRGKGFEGDFAINTALDASLAISPIFNERRHLLSSHTRTISAANFQLAGEENAVFARARYLDLGPFSITEPVAAVSRARSPSLSPDEHAGEIGAGILRRFTVTFDYPHQEMILNPNSQFSSDDLADMSGLSITAGGPGLKRFEITHVQPGSPASDEKIQEGDVIAGIDDEAAADMTLADVRELFRQVGHKYKLLLERNGQTLTVTIQMRHLI